jgi:predicted ATPase/DNA-binding CsgD family transcriptional regulator
LTWWCCTGNLLMTVGKDETVINGKFSDWMEKTVMYPQSPLDEGTRLTRPALPIVLTPFVGREQTVKDVCTLLCCSRVRLLTLTGTAGVGKTRLGVEVATRLTNDFADGVCFVPLVAIRDPELVIPTIARQLGVQEIGMQSIFEQVKVALQEKQVLLILDNFEQVMGAAFHVEDLLVACTSLKVVVTSREVLHLQAEKVYPVSPLPLPDPDQVPEHVLECETLAEYPAVKLFIERVQTISPSFTMNSTNARDIIKICVRLDGLPLALELAAIRMRLLPLSALLARISSGRLQVLKQTLRNTIQWSYDLLTVEEQQLFRRLSVFVGGFAVEGAETMAQLSDDGKPSGCVSVLDCVESLLDKSLLLQVGQEGEEPRLTMFETIREYGLERLQECGEAQMCQRAHAMYYLTFAQEAEPHLKGGQQALWWKRLELEQENLRAALAWLIEQGEGEQALSLCNALWRFWNQRGYWSEGLRWLEAALQLPQAQGRTVMRANALLGAAELTYRLGDPVVASSYADECQSIYRELGDKRGLALLLSGLGWAMFLEKGMAVARPLLKEGLDLARELGDRWILAYALQNQGDVMCRNGDFESARSFLRESVTLYRELQDKQSLSRRLIELGRVSPVAQAAALARESLELAQELGNEPDVARALYALAVIQSLQHDAEQAVILLEKSLALFREQGDKLYIGLTLLTLGGIVLYQGDLAQAETYAQESLTHLRAIGGPYKTSLALRLLGDVRRMQGDLTQARTAYKEGLSLAIETGNRLGMSRNLIGLARVVAAEGRLEQAACLFGIAEPLFNPRVDFHPEMDPFECKDYECVVESVRTQLGAKAFMVAWNKGQNLTPEQALANLGSMPLTVSASTVSPSTPDETAPTLDGLTPREMDVLRQLAQGLTSAEIAEKLFISVVTVNFHIRSIYSKIGVSSRAAATRYAIEHGLV